MTIGIKKKNTWGDLKNLPGTLIWRGEALEMDYTREGENYGP